MAKSNRGAFVRKTVAPSGPLVKMQAPGVFKEMNLAHATNVLALQKFQASKDKWALDPTDTNYEMFQGEIRLKVVTPDPAPAPAKVVVTQTPDAQ